MTIGGLDVNPKEFFDEWKVQMTSMIKREANKIVKEQLSDRLLNLMNPIQEIEQVLDHWATQVNWEVKNPLTK